MVTGVSLLVFPFCLVNFIEGVQNAEASGAVHTRR
jgi:hypothetical protein